MSAADAAAAAYGFFISLTVVYHQVNFLYACPRIAVIVPTELVLATETSGDVAHCSSGSI